MKTTDANQRAIRYFGYPISAALYQQVIATIEQIQKGGDTEHLCRQSADTLIAITDAGFDAYYEQPAKLAGISPRLKKATDTGIHAVQKGIHLVIRKLLKNRKIKDLERLANNFSYLICVDNQNPDNAYACFRLEEDLYQKVVANMRRVHEDPNIESYRRDVIDSVEDLISAGIDMFYTKPVDQADIGRITRKAADLGIHTVQKGSNAVVHRLFKDMDYATLLPMAEYFETLLHSEVQTYKHFLRAAH
ncbi:MAG: hypothetical protein CMK83_05180 [Pseudomonadales bacterium]|jgi:hypothetical protein|nr:hypothetical protein [Pseudomonadales bacterium]MEC8812827.1 hypothetical protein [Pseudomonadota bacterium]TNC90792.1 MAG: hypothetical protein CSH49_01255 [Alcanivorax sp.]HAG92883.1 hypothetical protein [Gammaproteobacteria bacterium]HAU14310.1 hypothetical protein [Gammaproteobacteria bacterium]|tara:strand:- start:39560 stop:40303 length:744 start_codon:yes stop_codon:yes gene_type:complete